MKDTSRADATQHEAIVQQCLRSARMHQACQVPYQEDHHIFKGVPVFQ